MDDLKALTQSSTRSQGHAKHYYKIESHRSVLKASPKQKVGKIRISKSKQQQQNKNLVFSQN